MKKQQLISKDSEKVPSYVAVYNTIYAKIVDGTYKDGEAIPSETQLAKEYGVSRHTLRQALTILTEDRLIKKQQGKGSIVTLTKRKGGNLKSYFNPMTECAITEVDKIDINYNFAPPTNVACEKLGITSYDMLLASNNVYYANNQTIGYSFMQIPLDYAKSLHTNIKNRKEIANLLNKEIFKAAKSAHISLHIVNAHENIRGFLDVPKDETLIYIEELLLNQEDSPICRCKFYFIPEMYHLDLWI